MTISTEIFGVFGGVSRKRERKREGAVEKLGKETRQGARGNIGTAQRAVEAVASGKLHAARGGLRGPARAASAGAAGR